MEPVDFVAEPLDALEHPTVARSLGILEVLGHQVEVHLDRGERIADLVGQAAGEQGDLGILGSEPTRDLRLFTGLDRCGGRPVPSVLTR